MVTQTPSTVPLICSATEYTITCDVTVSCTRQSSDNINSYYNFYHGVWMEIILIQPHLQSPVTHHSFYRVLILILVHLLQWEM